MAHMIIIDQETQDAVMQLQQKLGADNEAALLLTIVVTSWSQLALLYEESELRHGRNVSGAASCLSSLSQAMMRYRDDLAAGQVELRQLHDQVVSRLRSASGRIREVRNVMKDVINEYNQFEGNVAELKKGVGSLVQASLGTLNPVLATSLSPVITKIFG